MKIFISYARVDSKYREELSHHLATLVRNGEIELFEDSQLRAGSNWEKEIDFLLDTADIVLSLVSANYFSSAHCMKELKRALARSERKEILLIPIVIRAVAWTRSELHRFQALPDGGKAVSTWANTDEAYVSISEGILDLIKQHTFVPSEQDRRKPAPEPAPPARSRWRPPEPAPVPAPVLSKPSAYGAGGGAAVVSQKSPAAVYEAYDYENPATRFFR